MEIIVSSSRFIPVMLLAGLVLAPLAASAIDDGPSQPAALARLSLAQGDPLAMPLESSDRRVFPSLDGATTWLNSPPLTAAGLRGKVVLVEFWTYSCINWRREYPYVRAWAAKYKDRGLVVIGVHSPEFTFETDLDNVRRAAKDIGANYPIAVDSEHAIWRAFGNAYWPALYFIDAQGRVRHHHHGEGDYDQSERVIQQLLSEAGAIGVEHNLVSVAASGAEASADWEDVRSAENYVGYARTSNFASANAAPNKPRTYEAPARLLLNQWALAGDWTLQDEAAVLNKATGRIVYNFHARDLHLVMGPATRSKPVQFRISIDGKPPGAARGVDVDEQGRGMVSEHRMYQLIRQQRPITDRRFEIEFLDPGVEVFAFTFG
jgi:thiol-disulfide isomerase/thioredoxin